MGAGNKDVIAMDLTLNMKPARSVFRKNHVHALDHRLPSQLVHA